MGRERRTYTIDGEEVGPAEWRDLSEPGIVLTIWAHNCPLVDLGSKATSPRGSPTPQLP